MSNFFTSTKHFITGILERWLYWIPSLLLDPFDLYRLIVKQLFPLRFQRNVDIPIYWFFIALTVGLVFAALRSYHDLHTEKEKLESELEYWTKPVLEIIFERKPPFIQQAHNSLYRIGVRASGHRSATKVQVELTKIEPRPQPIQALPVPLHIMHDNPTTPREYKKEFSLEGDKIIYIDVIEQRGPITKDGVDQHPRWVAITHAVDQGNLSVPEGNYNFTIAAHADNAPSCQKLFVVEIGKDAQLNFSEL